MDKPKYRSFSVCVTDTRGVNNKSLSLYGDIIDFDKLLKLLKLILIIERDKYLDSEVRYGIEKPKKELYTHYVQLFQHSNTTGRSIKTKGFGINEYSYNANEITDIINMWMKKRLRKDIPFPSKKFLKIVRGDLSTTTP